MMRVNEKTEFILKSYLTIFAPASLIFNFTQVAYANNATEFVKELKEHYQSTRSIKAFSLTHSYLGQSNPYQSWDFKVPTRYKAFKVTDIDMTNEHYYQNVVHHYTGGLYFDEVHFQNDRHSLRYERNGISLGKRAAPQNMKSYERYKNLTLMNIDFFAVNPLLEEQNVAQNVVYSKANNKVTLTHHASQKSEIEYTFSTNPIRLNSINNKTRNRIFIYDDYKYNNGFYLAHSLIKHYNGDTLPSFITRIEAFNTIDRIEPEKLVLPQGFYLKQSPNNRALKVTSIANKLYLITDESNHYNTLFYVNDNDITVLGVPRNANMAVDIIEKIKQVQPDKSITGVYVTHPYSDHIAGLVPFVDNGATVYADSYTISAIKQYAKFKNDISRFKFSPITHGHKMYDIQFFVLENARAKKQSFAHFKNAGIIFQTDFLEIANDNTIAKLLPSYSHQFIQFVLQEKLNVKRIVGYHRNNNITKDVMEKSLKTNTL